MGHIFVVAIVCPSAGISGQELSRQFVQLGLRLLLSTGVIGVEPSRRTAPPAFGMPAATQKLCSLHYETGDQGASAAGGVGTILLSAGQKVQKRSQLHTQPYQRGDFSSRW